MAKDRTQAEVAQDFKEQRAQAARLKEITVVLLCSGQGERELTFPVEVGSATEKAASPPRLT